MPIWSAGLPGSTENTNSSADRMPGLVVPAAGAVEDRDRDDHRRAGLLDLDVRERHRRIAAAQVVDPQRRRARRARRPWRTPPRSPTGDAVDGGDEVEGLQAGLRRRRVGIEHADLGQVKARRHADPADASPCAAACPSARSRTGVTSRSSASEPRRIPKRSVVPARIGDHALQLFPVADLLAVDGLDAVAGQQARPRPPAGWAAPCRWSAAAASAGPA